MKLRLTLSLFFVTVMVLAQNQEWGSYFSYTNVVDMAQNAGRVFSASESAIFSQNLASGELKTTTSVDGLKADDISAIFYSPSTQKTLVGNSNGLLLVINNDGTVTSKIDIVNESTVPSSIKKINHFYEYNGLVYISCDFGIAVFNPATMLFGDTYYINPNGGTLAVRNTTVHEGYIYAATENGIRRAQVSNPFLIDHNQWSEVYSGGWKFVLSYSNALFCVSDWNAFIKRENEATSDFAVMPNPITDLREANGYMVVTCSNRVNVYDNNLIQVTQINTVGETATFYKATRVGQRIYIGTKEKGVFAADINSFTFYNITPNGPLRSNIFSLEKSGDVLWAVFGGFDYYHTPNVSKYGISRYSANTGWENISYETMSLIGNVQKEVTDLSDIVVNPNNPNEVFFNSFGSGLLRMTNMVSDRLYEPTNTNNVLQNQEKVPGYYNVRTIGSTFDTQGKQWMLNTRTTKPLIVLNGNSWQSYNFSNIFGEDNMKEIEYEDMVIDRNGTKWIGTMDYGLVAFNEAMNNKFIRILEDDGLPSSYVKALAIDNSGRLWIGTARGLRVIYSTERFTTENSLEASQIIILEDGVAQELMYQQAITDIVVDGSNNKWIATSGAGAYLISPDGQQTLFHFTKENSPLPSNNINDVAIDNATGEVFFATDKGMVSYKGSSTEGADDLSGVYVYPNPVRPTYNGDVKISGLTDNANVKVTDIEGNLVFEATSEGGTVLWDTTAFGKYKVRSGVYMIFISTEDVTETKVKKVMIIRGN